MKNHRHLLLTFIFFFSASVSLVAGGNEKILGKWYDTNKEGIIEIYECNGGKLCGKIVWLSEPNEKDGKPKKDINNPDAKQHDNPIIGLNILSGFVKSGDNHWEDGKIYDPKNGKLYSCKMTLDGDKLEVRGYIGISLFGRTEHWTRAPK